jgi:two-component system NarL family sensor kinase
VAGLGCAAWGSQAVAAGEPWWHVAVIAVVLVAPATVAAALAARLPGNPVGWLLLASTAATAAAGAAGRWAESHPTAPAASWAAWLDAVLWAFGPPLLPLIALVFPDGRPVGRVGRWGVRAAVAGIVLIAVSSAFMPGPLAGFSSTPGPDNPLGVPVLTGLVPVLATCIVALLVSAASLAIFTLVRRWRRGLGSERLALAVAGAPLMAALCLHLSTLAIGVNGEAVAVAASLVAAIGVPAGIWVAVTRYRLYDLDLAAARTLGYAILAVGLAAVFAVTAAMVGLVAGGDSRVVVAVAAAAAATAFAPSRGHVVGRVERWVLGPVGDPERAAAVVARRLAAIQNPDLLPELAAEAVEDVLRLRGVRVVPLGRAYSGAADVRCPLSHHGIELGTLAAPAPVSAAGRRALTAVAEPVAAALHAAALAAAVRRSRAELVAAVEEERREPKGQRGWFAAGPALRAAALFVDLKHSNGVSGSG